MHGGLSTGPRTPEGLARCKQAVTRHGYYSREAKAERWRQKAQIRGFRRVLALLEKAEKKGPDALELDDLIEIGELSGVFRSVLRGDV